MKPTIGRVVIYTPTKQEIEVWEKSSPPTTIPESTKLPAEIIAVWSESCINVKVMPRTPGELVRMSINKGDNPGEWEWPVLEK